MKEFIVNYLIACFIGILATIVIFLFAPSFLIGWLVKFTKTYKYSLNQLKSNAIQIINAIISKGTVALNIKDYQKKKSLENLNEYISDLEKLGSDLFVLDTLTYLFDSITFVTFSKEETYNNLERTFEYISCYTNKLSDALKKGYRITEENISELFNIVINEKPENLLITLNKVKAQVEKDRQNVINTIRDIQNKINQETNIILDI